MTSRPRRHREQARRLAAADYPALESFFSGYLHEDFVEEHGTPAGALRAFRTDADAADIERFEHEAARLLAATAELPLEDVAEFIRRELGGTWRPASLKQLQDLLKGKAG
jgi:hypothetical protein